MKLKFINNHEKKCIFISLQSIVLYGILWIEWFDSNLIFTDIYLSNYFKKCMFQHIIEKFRGNGGWYENQDSKSEHVPDLDLLDRSSNVLKNLYVILPLLLTAVILWRSILELSPDWSVA